MARNDIPGELGYIVTRSAGLEVTTSAEGAFEIARGLRGTPRIANRLLRRMRDFADVRADGRIATLVDRRQPNVA